MRVGLPHLQIFSSRWQGTVRGAGARHPALLLVLILWLACAVRWYDPGLIPYTYDDASQVAIASSIGGNPLGTDAHYPLLSGGTTLGVQRSALHAYVLAGFLALGGKIEAAVWGVGALGVLATTLVYRLGYQVGGARVGRWSALFMAANPWLIYHDRRLWAHIYTVLSVLLLLLAWRVVVDRQMRAALWVLPVLALQTLAHTLGVVQATAVAGALLAAPRSWFNRFMAAGALIGLILLAPYVWTLGEQVWQARQTGAGVWAVTGEPAATELAPRLANLLRSNHWTLLNHMATGSGFSSTIGRDETGSVWWRLGVYVAVPLVWLFLAAGLLRLVVDLFHPLRGVGMRLLLWWAVLPLLLLGVQPVRIAFQYWTVLLPLPALVAALGVDWLAAGAIRLKLPRWAGLGLSYVPATTGLLVVALWLGSYATVHSLRAMGDAGTPLRFWQAGIAVAEAAARQADTDEIRFAVSGLDPAFDGEAATVATLIGNPPYARFVAPGEPPALLLNYTRPSLYYWTLDSGRVAAPVGEGNEFNGAPSLLRWGEEIWQGNPAAGEPRARLFRLPAYGALEEELNLSIQTLEEELASFDVGIRLLGVAFPEVSQADVPQVYTLIWRVLAPAEEVRTRDFTAFNHIIDANGERLAQVDGLALLSRDWWPDDVLVQSYVMALPAGELVWRTGLYSRVDGGRAYTAAWADGVDIPLRVEAGLP